MKNKKNIKKHFLLLIVLLFSLVLITACGNKGKTEADIKNEEEIEKSDEASLETDKVQGQVDVLRIPEGTSGYPTPWRRGIKGGGGRVLLPIYDSLLEKDKEGLVPWLAKNYEILEGGKEYLFTLRDNIVWHDGEKFTAEDVKFTFEYMKKFPVVSMYVTKDDIEKVEVISDTEVLITSKDVSAPILEAIGSTLIFPKHIWENVENPMEYEGEGATVGTGPYVLTDYNISEDTARYDAFDKFWGPTPAAKTLLKFKVADEILAIESGEIDVSRHVTNDIKDNYKDHPILKVENGPALSGSRLLFNLNNNKIFKNKELRQAFYYTFDTNEMIEKLGRRAGEPSNAGILPPAHPMYNPNVKKYELNLEKAGELLDELGYSEVDKNGIRMNDKGEKLSFETLTSEKGVRSAELLREQLLRGGIELNLVTLDTKTQEERVRQGEFELAVVGHAGLGSDADYLRERYMVDELVGTTGSSMATVGYENQELFDLLEEQRITLDLDKRKELIFKVQEIIAEDVLEIMFYYGYDFTIWNKEKYDGWTYPYDERCYTSSKLSFVLYSQWDDK